MKKLLSFCLLLFSVAFFALFNESKRETHSLFYIKNDNLHAIMKNDRSFSVTSAFYFIEKLPILKSKIDTGEYEIQYGENVFSVINKMFLGKKVIRKLTIPEGYTVKRIVEVLNSNKFLFGEISGCEIKEGELSPNTYFYTFGDSKISIINKMRNQMAVVRSKYYKQNKTNLSFDEVVILASIIEKESGNFDEQPLISSVFHNRLAIGMRLQSDPTVIYALTDGYGIMERKITRKDLLFSSPYNTYRNAGLPPAPICCPGENAIKAVLNPKETNYMFFVAKADHSGHIFAKEYKEHLKNIQKVKLATKHNHNISN